MLIDNLRNSQPALVDEVVPKLFSLGEIQKVLCNLLRENVSIRDMGTIIEVMSDYGSTVRDTELLTEYVRKSLARAISSRFVPDGKARVITLDPKLEQLIGERVKQTEQGSYVALDQDQVQRLYLSLKAAVENETKKGITPIVLTSPAIRRHFKNVTAQMIPDLVVLSYNEMDTTVEVFSDGVISI